MSEQIVTSPIITDETGQDMLTKLDSIISALSPNAQGVSFDKTGCQIITTNNVQDAVKQLDTGLNNTNSNLAQLIKTESITSSSITVANNDRGVFTIDVSKTGYTPIGIGVVTFSNNYMFLGAFNLSGNSATVVCHNRTGSASTLTVTITVIYIKS